MLKTEDNDAKLGGWISWDKLDKSMFSGYLAAATAIGGCFSFPFYVLTTRQQVGSQMTGDKVMPMNGGVLSGLREAYGKIGLRGLYRGYPQVALVNMPSNIVYLSVTEATRQFVFRYAEKNYGIKEGNHMGLDLLQVTFSGIFANMTSYAITNSNEVMVCRMVTRNDPTKATMRYVANEIYSKYGIRGFWHGYTTNLVYGTSGSIAWWLGYTYSRRFLCKYVDPEKQPAIIDGISGFIAGFSCTAFVHPLDTIRAKIMTGASAETTMLGCLREVRRTQGVRVLWRGLLSSFCETGVSSTVFALAYEFIKRSSRLAGKEIPDLD